MMIFDTPSSVHTSSVSYQTITLNTATNSHVIDIKRIDLIHPHIAGNKWYKLKYNLIQAKKDGYQQILSFGGAYSNHIYALAHACRLHDFDSIGIIRGDELAHKPLNQQLKKAHDLGMQLLFISRSAYRLKHTSDYIKQLQADYPNAYIIPEGGSNDLAIRGCQEIIDIEDQKKYDLICCAVGTGGTVSGIINASSPQQSIIGFTALNADLSANVKQWSNQDNWKLYPDNRFGGYGRYDDELMSFINNIHTKYNIPLEPIYTGKALYRLFHMLERDIHPYSGMKIARHNKNMRILFIHTGGLYSGLSLT